MDRVFDNPVLFTPFENLSALFVYSLQVYADFSGYTDIAIGVAMLMGFYLPKNFNSPYKATNAGNFWKRWHISLSNWLKDYLYIPLGGNRKGKVRTYINMMITMLLGGLWHGASWNFVIWGGLNGVGILIYKLWKKMKYYWKTVVAFLPFLSMVILNNYSPQPIWRIGCIWTCIIFVGTIIRHLYTMIWPTRDVPWLDKTWGIFQTFIFISFTRLFFRSGSNLDPAIANATAWNTAKAMVGQIGSIWDFSVIPEILYAYRYVFILFSIGMIIHWLPDSLKRRYRYTFAVLPIWCILILSVLVVFCLYHFVTADLQPFIYFQF